MANSTIMTEETGADAAIAAEAEADELMARAIHDLKTPLAALKQALQVLSSGRAGGLTLVQSRFVTMGLDNAAVLASLMDRMRRPPGDGAGLRGFRPARICLTRSVDFVLGALGASADSKGVRLRANHARDAPEAWADEDLVRRIVLNLVENAIKHGAEGGEASAGVTVTQVDSDFVAISVADQGPGVAPQDQQRVFDSRFRGPLALRHHEGSGLGLAIVRDIAQAHGGDASVRNNDGPGCTFTVTLPRFGTGRGSSARLARLAAARRGSLELIVVTAQPGTAGRLADGIIASMTDGEDILDLGRGSFGLVRGDVPRRDMRGDVDALLGPHRDIVASAGFARAQAAGVDACSLIAMALASQRPYPFAR